MAELGEAQRVVYGDLAAVYNDLPFTLSHWRVTHARRVAPDNTSAGQDRRYELTGWIAADDESALATAKAAAEAVLGADGGDFRVQIPKWNPGPFPSVTWHTIEALLSADCQDGIRVAELSVAPAGGPRLDVALTLAAFVPDADDAGIVWATWTDAAEDDDEGRPGRSSAGQVKARRGVSPSLYVQSVVLPNIARLVV